VEEAVETRPNALTRGESTSAPVAALVGLSTLSAADRAAWRELQAHRPDSSPFVEEEWVGAWSQAFGPRDPLLVCDWEEGRLDGLGVLQSVSESWAGRRTAVLQSLTSVESPRFEFLSAGGRRDVQERLWRALCTARRWDVIRVEHLPEDSPALSAGIAVADALGWNRVVEETLISPWRPLPQLPEAWDEGLKRKFKANLRNRERRLEALGAVAFTVIGTGAEQAAALETFYALEASGWKGKQGTAIARRASTKAFYDGLWERTTRDWWIPILSLDGRPVAAQLIRVRERTLFLLKTAYDPEFAPYAPGQLLTARVMRYGIDHGMQALDFLGDTMTWKQDWEPCLRRHYRISLFAPSTRGRYAYWTRYGLREHGKKIPGARRLVHWLRGLRRPNGAS
jgi:CelD/BcsL family acetyltransferase involved in cellulose biosynthesis